MKIAIKTNIKLQFPPANVGYIRIEIDLIQNKQNESVYELRLKDTCFDIINSEEVVLATNTRFKKYNYADINYIGQIVNVDFSDNTQRINQINEIFARGLLAITQQECLDGISGIPDKGMYFSEVQNWELDL
jgi:hypothetical protein